MTSRRRQSSSSSFHGEKYCSYMVCRKRALLNLTGSVPVQKSCSFCSQKTCKPAPCEYGVPAFKQPVRAQACRFAGYERKSFFANRFGEVRLRSVALSRLQRRTGSVRTLDSQQKRLRELSRKDGLRLEQNKHSRRSLVGEYMVGESVGSFFRVSRRCGVKGLGASTSAGKLPKAPVGNVRRFASRL
jgi:hypothetical protein